MATVTPHDEEREFAFDESEFRFLADLAHRHTGIVLGDHKRDMVYGRLARRLRALGLPDFAAYCELVQSDHGHEELGNLVNAITTNLTSFFREGHHFEHLHNTVLAPIADGPKRRIRIWSAGCSSGMEPYSIAMTLRGALPANKGWDARILATDIDTNMLATGRTGDYPASEYDRIPARYRQCAHVNGERVQMSDDIRSLITFNPLNLLHDWPMRGPFDVIFCRNVVIYFDKPTQKTLFNRMADLLQPNGWLYIGHSENLNNVCPRFAMQGRTIYRRVA
jgi:chemotaxis protein methyltransferase CheR